MPETLDQFQYEPLENARAQIRLLQHVRTDPGEKLAVQMAIAGEGILSIAPLEERLSFHAISYTWGDAESTTEILVNGYPFTVRHNAYYALWQHALHHFEDYVWMDSICINQNDIAEKSQQVWAMANIYFSADLVTLCVGSHEKGSEVLPGFFTDLAATRHLAQQSSPHGEHPYLRYSERLVQWLRTLDTDYVSKVWDGFREFSMRSYWGRLWIVPENHQARAREVLCGEDIIHWSTIRIFIEELNTYISRDLTEELFYRMPYSVHFNASLFSSVAEHSDPGWQCLLSQLLSFLQGNTARDTLEAVKSVANFRCSDSRDRIYALRPLLRDPTSIPNYKQTVFDFAVETVGNLLCGSTARKDRLFCLGQQDEVQALLTALSISSRSPGFQEALQRRRPRCVRNSFPITRAIKQRFWHIVKAHRTETIGAVTRLSVLPNGSLSAHLKQYRSRDLWLKEPTLVHIFDEMRDRFDFRTIMIGSDAAGIVCSGTQDGDLLTPCGRHYDSSQLFVILRELDQDFFGVVGQGFTMNAYEICQEPICPSVDDHMSMRAEIVLSPEDAVIMAGRDLQFLPDRNSEFKEEFPTYDAQARFERLEASVSSEYCLAPMYRAVYSTATAASQEATSGNRRKSSDANR